VALVKLGDVDDNLAAGGSGLNQIVSRVSFGQGERRLDPAGPSSSVLEQIKVNHHKAGIVDVFDACDCAFR
jgi:hypothetical protein